MKFLVVLIPVLVVLAGALARPSTDEGKRLIRVSETETPKWLTEDEVFELMRQKIHFMDITDHPTRPAKKNVVRGKICSISLMIID